MTALLSLEEAEPDEVFTAPPYSPLPAESRINLRAGERMTVEDLLEALLLESANDAAVALAENISGSREAFVEEKGLVQVSDESALEGVIDEVMTANPKEVEGYRAGKEKLLGFFVGQVMKRSGGKANPGKLNELLKKKLQT